MMDMIFLEDSYRKGCTARIVSMEGGRWVELDETIFYPRGGGQPCDLGELIKEGDAFKLVDVFKRNGRIMHEVEREGLVERDNVQCMLDWDRRYALMRMHTAAHVLSSIMDRELGLKITGNQLDAHKSRFDFNMEGFDRERLENSVDQANRILKQNIDVKVYDLPKEEAMRIPGVVKLASSLPPDIPRLRIVEIPGVDIQADGGTHVRNLSEVGRIIILKLENKGKNNRRVYFTLS